MESTLALGTKEFWTQLTKDPATLAKAVCTIDLVELDTTLQQHPALRAWINAAHEVARIEEEKLKWEETRTRAAVLLAAHRLMDETTGKVKSVAVLTAEVDCDDMVQSIVERLHKQQEIRAALRAMANALEDRKDMLIQIAAKHRKESRDYS